MLAGKLAGFIPSLMDRIVKRYFLYVEEEELRHYSEQLHLLTGYVGTRVSMKTDPEHGPMDPEAEILQKCYPVLNIMSTAMADRINDLNEDMRRTRHKMAKEIINVIQNNESGMDLLLKLQETLDKYEIIGKRDIKPDDDYIPF
jgi:hypothetical protein